MMLMTEADSYNPQKLTWKMILLEACSFLKLHFEAGVPVCFSLGVKRQASVISLIYTLSIYVYIYIQLSGGSFSNITMCLLQCLSKLEMEGVHCHLKITGEHYWWTKSCCSSYNAFVPYITSPIHCHVWNISTGVGCCLSASEKASPETETILLKLVNYMILSTSSWPRCWLHPSSIILCWLSIRRSSQSDLP